MAYQESSYGPRSTYSYAGPTNNAGHFPLSHPQSLSLQHQSSSPSHFYSNPSYPPTPPHSNHPSSNASSPPPLSNHLHQHPHLQPSHLQTYSAQRLPYGPHQIQNGGGLVMQPPMSLPDDHFKKPYLPQQQYTNHAQSPANFIDHQRQKFPSAVSDFPSAHPYPGASTTPKRPHSSKSSYPPTSTMTVTAGPTNPSSTQSTPTSPSQSGDGGLPSLEQQRVDTLLHVNNLLLQEVSTLQKAGVKQSPQSPQQTPAPNVSSPQMTPAPPTSAGGDSASTTQNPTDPAPKPNPTSTTPTTTTPTAAAAAAAPQQSLIHKKYVEFMTRIKTNIFYLVSISSDQAKDKPRLPYPPHLEAPQPWLNPGNEDGDRQLDVLREEYARLRELWPEWKPEVKKPQPGGGQPQPSQQPTQQQQS